MFHDDRGLLQGTLELLILKALSTVSQHEAPAGAGMHGYGIARWIEAATDDALRVEEGSLYPALHRMAGKEWIEAEWGVSENNRRARYYRLTAAGRAHFVEKSRGWDHMVGVVQTALAAPAHPRGESS
jgi:transcriptional regulator